MFKELAPERNRWISPSSLCYCLRKAKWEFEKDYYYAERNAYMLFRGSIVHAMFAQNASSGSLVEEELKCQIPGTNFVMGARLDLWENGILWDYKTLSDNGIHILAREGVKEEHIWQTNIYKYMLKKAYKFETQSIRIAYVMMSNIIQSGEDFYIADRKGGGDIKHHLNAVPIYQDEKVLDFMVPKIKLVTEGYAPPAAPQDWLCKSCYFRKECEVTEGKGTATVENKDMRISPDMKLF